MEYVELTQVVRSLTQILAYLHICLPWYQGVAAQDLKTSFHIVCLYQQE